MSERFEPDKDERVTQVICIELLGKNAETMLRIKDKVQAFMHDQLAMVEDVDYMIASGQPDNLLTNPNMTDFMSKKQSGFLNKLIGDLRPLIGRYKVGMERGDALDPDVFRQAENVMTVVFQELDEHLRAEKTTGKGTIGPRRASELIDATKGVIDDLQGELNGV